MLMMANENRTDLCISALIPLALLDILDEHLSINNLQ